MTIPLQFASLCDGQEVFVWSDCLPVHSKTLDTLAQVVDESPRSHLHVVFDINQPSLPTAFDLFLCLFLSLCPFQLYFVTGILPKSLRRLTLFFQSYFRLVGPFNYIPLYESLPQP